MLTGSCHGRLQDCHCPRADVAPVVGEAGLKSEAGLVMGVSRAQQTVGLVSACWWAELGPRTLWLQGPGGSRSNVHVLVCDAGSSASGGKGHVQRWLQAQGL